MAIDGALRAHTADEAAEDILRSAAPRVARFEEALPSALSGGFASVVVVTSNWDALLEEALRSVAAVVPDVVEFVDVRRLRIHGEPADWVASALLAAVADAPFSRFVGGFGSGLGMALACVARVRDAIAELPPLVPPQAGVARFAHSVDVLRFRRLVDLAIRGLAPPLERLQEALGLSISELGELFGVSRQAIDQWRSRGIPADRRAKVADLVAVADLLDRKLKAGRLQLIARRPAAAFGGRTLLEFAADGDHAELRDRVERAFDWSTAA